MRFRSLLLSVAIAAGVVWPAALAQQPACAGESPRAALVVDTGESVLNLCVTLPEQSVSGIELVKLASKQHGLSYKLGFGGEAVCHLVGVGPTGDDCFEQDPDFWGYWRGDGSGGWTWASTGAGSTTVTDGSVEGWAWGPGTGPETHPAPPVTRFAEVCAAVEPSGDKGNKPEPEPAPEPGAGAPAPGSGEPTGAEPSRASDKQDKQDKQKKERRKGAPRPAVISTPSPGLTATPAPRPPAADLASSQLASDSDGARPPAAGIVALVGTVVLVGCGAVVARRRRPAE